MYTRATSPQQGPSAHRPVGNYISPRNRMIHYPPYHDDMYFISSTNPPPHSVVVARSLIADKYPVVTMKTPHRFVELFYIVTTARACRLLSVSPCRLAMTKESSTHVSCKRPLLTRYQHRHCWKRHAVRGALDTRSHSAKPGRARGPRKNTPSQLTTQQIDDTIPGRGIHVTLNGRDPQQCRTSYKKRQRFPTCCWSSPHG